MIKMDTFHYLVGLPGSVWLQLLAGVVTGWVLFMSWLKLVGTVRDGVYDKR